MAYENFVHLWIGRIQFTKKAHEIMKTLCDVAKLVCFSSMKKATQEEKK